ncbi:MAG: hypothetical protein Q3961_03480, partial [Bifidobacteriaceae bacterium]|nr:hypothetical protein [Bifidobacteriaceae bacterium]
MIFTSVVLSGAWIIYYAQEIYGRSDFVGYICFALAIIIALYTVYRLIRQPLKFNDQIWRICNTILPLSLIVFIA